MYAVSYAFDAVTGEGYVYLPGKDDENYRLNVHTIIRRVEGKWFHSWAKWDSVAEQQIESRKREQSSTTAAGTETVVDEIRDYSNPVPDTTMSVTRMLRQSSISDVR